MQIEKEITHLRRLYELAVAEDKGATYHVPILEVWPLIEKLLCDVSDLI
jgi:hypothetical protein